MKGGLTGSLAVSIIVPVRPRAPDQAAPLDKYTWVYAEDRQEVENEADAERQEVMACAISTYRRPDRLEVGDPAPRLVLSPLKQNGVAPLDAYTGSKPLVLIFGSYT